MFSLRFMLFPTFKIVFGVNKIIPGFFLEKQFFLILNVGNSMKREGGVLNFFLRKTILSHSTFYAIFNIKKEYIEKRPFTYWLNGRWFLQIVDRLVGSLTSLCHSTGHIETMPAREINPFTALTRIRFQFLRTQ